MLISRDFGEYRVIDTDGNFLKTSIFIILLLKEDQRLVYLSPIFFKESGIMPPLLHFHIEGADAKVYSECNGDHGYYCNFSVIGSSPATVEELVDFVENMIFGAIDFIDSKESFLKLTKIMANKSEESMKKIIEIMKKIFGDDDLFFLHDDDAHADDDTTEETADNTDTTTADNTTEDNTTPATENDNIVDDDEYITE